jgi:multidrug efflux system membrane fusion protein
VLQPDQTVAIRTVTVGTTDGNQTAVQGVNPGEVVATSNFDKLQDGVKVAVQNGANGTSQGNSP